MKASSEPNKSLPFLRCVLHSRLQRCFLLFHVPSRPIMPCQLWAPCDGSLRLTCVLDPWWLYSEMRGYPMIPLFGPRVSVNDGKWQRLQFDFWVISCDFTSYKIFFRSTLVQCSQDPGNDVVPLEVVEPAQNMAGVIHGDWKWIALFGMPCTGKIHRLP